MPSRTKFYQKSSCQRVLCQWALRSHETEKNFTSQLAAATQLPSLTPKSSTRKGRLSSPHEERGRVRSRLLQRFPLEIASGESRSTPQARSFTPQTAHQTMSPSSI